MQCLRLAKLVHSCLAANLQSLYCKNYPGGSFDPKKALEAISELLLLSPSSLQFDVPGILLHHCLERSQMCVLQPSFAI